MNDVRHNHSNASFRGTIVCFGTSNTYGYAPDCYPDFRYPEGSAWPEIIGAETDWLVLNHGICGRQIPCTQRQIRRIRDFARTWAEEYPAPVLLWIELGTNDLLNHDHFRAEDAAARMELFLTGLLEEPCVAGSAEGLRGQTDRRDTQLKESCAGGCLKTLTSDETTTIYDEGDEREHNIMCRKDVCGAFSDSLAEESLKALYQRGRHDDQGRRSGGASRKDPSGHGFVYLRLISPPCPRPGEWIPDPSRADEFGRLGIVYRDLARKLGVDYTDTTPWNLPLAYDGVHLTEEGHRIFAKRAMEEILSQDSGPV